MIHERGGGFQGEASLALLGPVPVLAPGHPLPWRYLPEDDAVEARLPVVDGQDAAALLGEIGRGDPGHEGLVEERWTFRLSPVYGNKAERCRKDAGEIPGFLR